MEESSAQYPLVNVNNGITQGASPTGSPSQSSGEIGAPSESADFDPRNLIPVPIVFCDDDGQIVWLNTAAEELTGFSSHHLVGKVFTELFSEDKRTGIARRVMRWRRRGEGDLYLEEPIQTATLQPHWIGVRVKRVPAPAGKEVYVCSLHDLQAMRDELESMRRQVSELEARIEEAAATVQLKSEFIRTISEDIRAPMSGVVGMSRFLLETELNPEQLTFAEVIESSGQQLLDVVDDLLDFSRIEAGELEIQSIDFDVRVAVEAVAVTLGTRATDRRLRFAFGVDKQVQSELIGDPGRFRQVLLNLGEAVIEETKGGEVNLRVGLAEESARALTLQVAIETSNTQDHSNSEEDVFELFASGDSSDLRRLGSRGLGLNLCRQILSLMRGEIVEMGGETAGLSFSVPFQKQVLPEVTSAPEEIGLEGIQVIIGDPVAENGTWLSETLTGWGCSVTETSTGEEVVEVLRSKVVSGFTRLVALVDLDLPGISTEELSSAVRSDASISDTKLVMITSIGRRGDAEMASGLGFRAYLTKPIEPVDLREAVIEVMRTQPSQEGSPTLITRHLLAERRHSEMPTEPEAQPEPAASEKWTPPSSWVTESEAVEMVDAVEPEVTDEPETPVEMVDPVEPEVMDEPETETEVETAAQEEPEVEAEPETEVETAAQEEPEVEAETETEVETAAQEEPEVVAEPETPVEMAAQEEPEVIAEPETEVNPVAADQEQGELHSALKAKNEALLDLTQVLGLQATLAKGRLRKAIQIGNRREIEWEARSLEKMYGATGADALSKRFRELAGMAGSVDMDELQSKWDEVERHFEQGDSPMGASQKAA